MFLETIITIIIVVVENQWWYLLLKLEIRIRETYLWYLIHECIS